MKTTAKQLARLIMDADIPERLRQENERLRALVLDVIYAAQGDVRTTPDPIAVLSELGWFDKAKAELGMVPAKPDLSAEREIVSQVMIPPAPDGRLDDSNK